MLSSQTVNLVFILGTTGAGVAVLLLFFLQRSRSQRLCQGDLQSMAGDCGETSLVPITAVKPGNPIADGESALWQESEDLLEIFRRDHKRRLAEIFGLQPRAPQRRS